MAITKDKFNQLGRFDESFVICGSDVELCIRAYKKGYFNVMCAESKLYHYESKTRSSFVPESDFRESESKYAPYRIEKCDPFFNPNLSLLHANPTLNDRK
jgi:GT2 family glycosyltransferase